MSNNLKSFSKARKAFQANLAALLQQFSYTPTIFSMKLNQSAFASGTTKAVVTSEDIAAYLNGTKVPSLYTIYKLTGFFNITIDSLLSSEPIQTTTVTGRSFAKQTALSPKIVSINNETTLEETTMTAKKTTKNNNSNTRKMKDLIETRTSSTTYNMPLAYKILTSDMQQKEIANKVGISAGSLRDYSYYSVSMDQDIALKLAKVLNTNTTGLGLRLNKDTMRFETVTK